MSQLLIIEGITVRRDNFGRYCLNDLHRAAGGEERHSPNRFTRIDTFSSLVLELAPDLAFAPFEVQRGGANPGTYVCKELVYAYAMWISPSFNLKVIRTFDNVYQSAKADNLPHQIQAGIMLLESASKLLNLSNSSKLGGFHKLQQFAGLPNLMPAYAIDAPIDAVDGSSRPTKALSYLLKDHAVNRTANQVYHQLVKLGVIEQRERPSRAAVGGVKKFWTLTAKGCLYGKNMTSTGNPRETQPHFFESKFPALLKLLETVH